MCENPYAGVRILPLNSMASVGPMDEKVDVAKSFANVAVRKYIQFATPNEESELWALNTLFIEKMQKLDF